jgi:hypothetical protein
LHDTSKDSVRVLQEILGNEREGWIRHMLTEAPGVAASTSLDDPLLVQYSTIRRNVAVVKEGGTKCAIVRLINTDFAL